MALTADRGAGHACASGRRRPQRSRPPSFHRLPTGSRPIRVLVKPAGPAQSFHPGQTGTVRGRTGGQGRLRPDPRSLAPALLRLVPRRHRRLGHGDTDGSVTAISESIPTAEARASGPLQAACGRLARARWAPEDAAFVPIAAATRGDGGRRPRYIQPQPAAITHYDTLRQALTVIAAAITAAPARGDDCRRQRQRPALTHTASAGISGGDEDKALFSRAGTMRDAARRRS